VKTKKRFILIFLIVALAFFLRFWNIDNTPPGTYPDEAVNGVDAMNALEHGEWQWFYPANNGREGLFMNLIAISFLVFGVSVFALKSWAIFFGTLTVLGTYLLAKELFQKERIALTSAFLVATSFWAINFSRISFRANVLPFVLVFSFYFLFKGVRTKKYRDFAFGGMFFGLGLHTYISFRIAPLILVVMLATFIINRDKFLKNFWKHILVFVLFTTIISAPMLYTFFYSHPEYFQSRTGNVSIFNPEINGGSVVKTFLKSFGLSIAKYNFWGDQNWRHNYPPYALLDPISGIAFTVGLIYCIGRFFHLLFLRFRKKEKHPALEIYMFILVWFFSMLIPEFLTAEGNPHALRAIGTIPIVFIIASFFFDLITARAEKFGYTFRKVTSMMVILMIILIGLFNSVKYHYSWANNPETARAFDKNIRDVTNYVHSLPSDKKAFVVVEVMQRIPIQLFNWEAPNIFYYYPGEIDQIDPADRDYEVVLTDMNDEVVTNLSKKFPYLKFEEKKDSNGISYYIMK
jgi:4-amino-4-deoxy-L-arabinose transferase-like glycosyltransferase